MIEDPRGPRGGTAQRVPGAPDEQFRRIQRPAGSFAWAHENGIRRLRVVSDSELMVKQMKGLFKVGSPGLRPLWEEAKRLAKSLDRFEMRHTLRGGNQEADRLANEAMDKGMGRPAGSSTDSSTGSAPRPSGSIAGKNAQTIAKPARQVFEGYVKGGVVHLLEGDLPEGTFVKVIRE